MLSVKDGYCRRRVPSPTAVWRPSWREIFVWCWTESLIAIFEQKTTEQRLRDLS
jgi:hypothetical protein